jgi:hypothetical protein
VKWLMCYIGYRGLDHKPRGSLLVKANVCLMHESIVLWEKTRRGLSMKRKIIICNFITMHVVIE